MKSHVEIIFNKIRYHSIIFVVFFVLILIKRSHAKPGGVWLMLEYDFEVFFCKNNVHLSKTTTKEILPCYRCKKKRSFEEVPV